MNNPFCFALLFAGEALAQERAASWLKICALTANDESPPPCAL